MISAELSRLRPGVLEGLTEEVPHQLLARRAQLRVLPLPLRILDGNISAEAAEPNLPGPRR